MNINQKQITNSVQDTDYALLSQNSAVRRFSFANILAWIRSRLLANNITTSTAGNYALDAAQAQNLLPFDKTISSFSSLPQTITDSRINENTKVVVWYLSNPSAQTGEWTFTPSNGSGTISGSISGSTSVTLTLQTGQSS